MNNQIRLLHIIYNCGEHCNRVIGTNSKFDVNYVLLDINYVLLVDCKELTKL